MKLTKISFRQFALNIISYMCFQIYFLNFWMFSDLNDTNPHKRFDKEREEKHNFKPSSDGKHHLQTSLTARRWPLWPMNVTLWPLLKLVFCFPFRLQKVLQDFIYSGWPRQVLQHYQTGSEQRDEKNKDTGVNRYSGEGGIGTFF